MIEFVSYDGKWPNLCSGELVLRIDGKERRLHRVLKSGGMCGFTEHWDGYVEQGPWSVNLPEDLLGYKEEIERVVNKNVEWGCCGGCL